MKDLEIWNLTRAYFEKSYFLQVQKLKKAENMRFFEIFQ